MSVFMGFAVVVPQVAQGAAADSALPEVIETVVESSAPPVSLRGSPQAMALQHQVAVSHGLSFFQTRDEIAAAAERGELVRLESTAEYDVADFVDPRFIHPAALLFVEHIAPQYQEACGDRLVVTSGVRAIEDQPANSHALSVHPTGMAVDLRVSQRTECQNWLEAKLMELEEQGLLNGIREYSPPHYHVAVFPQPMARYVEAQRALEAENTPSPEPEEAREPRTFLATMVFLAILLVGAALIAWRWRRRQTSRPEQGDRG